MRDVLADRGHAELFKCGIHFGMFALAAMCAGYGAMAYGQRGERRLLTNAVLYTLLMVWESEQIVRHLAEP